MNAAPSRCYYCGNNPTSHTIARISEYVSLLNRPIEWLGSSALGRLVEQGLGVLGVPLARLAELLGMLKFDTDIEKAVTDRSKVIWEEARRRGIPMRQLVLFGRHLDVYEARVAGKTIIFESLPVPVRLQTSAIRWMDDKLKLKKRLQKAGIPVARGGAFTRFAPMLDLFRVIDKPVIIKPAVGSRGRHTTTFINTEEDLRRAFDIGKQLSRRLVMEEHLIGSVYRGTVIGGTLVGVLRGDPPRVIGDGKHTIAELITIKNESRHPEVQEFVVTDFTKEFLSREGYSLETIPDKGRMIDLREKIGTSYGGYRVEEFPICHPKTKRYLEEAGRVVNFPTMGFDFIIADITKDPDTQKWGIIECNSLPFIDLHHHPLEGPKINAAKYVWDFWE